MLSFLLLLSHLCMTLRLDGGTGSFPRPLRPEEERECLARAAQGDESARAMVLLAHTPLENCVFHVSNNHFVPMDDVITRLDKIDGVPLDYLENEDFLKLMKEAQAKPGMARILAPLVAYQQSASEQEGVETLPSTGFSMQVLHRLGFRWNPTSSQYVDLIFEMLRTLQYFE